MGGRPPLVEVRVPLNTHSPYLPTALHHTPQHSQPRQRPARGQCVQREAVRRQRGMCGTGEPNGRNLGADAMRKPKRPSLRAPAAAAAAPYTLYNI